MLLSQGCIPTGCELPETEPEVEQGQPPRKQPKSKKVKSFSPTPIPQVANEKPATRKSERIDKEKLKDPHLPEETLQNSLLTPKTQQNLQFMQQIQSRP